MARRSSIVIRIGLDGGKDITQELRQLGVTGERAFKQIKTAADGMNSVGARISGVVNKINTAFKTAAANVDKFKKSIDGLGRSIGTVATRLGLLTTAAAGVAGIFTGLSINAGRQAEELQNAASATGLAVDEYQKFNFAVQQTGATTEQFTNLMSVLTDQMDQTAQATEPAETALGRLGISATDSAGDLRSASSVLQEVMDRFATMEDGAEKTAMAIDIFGRRIGPRLIPFLNLGSQGLRTFGDEAERLGVVLSDVQLQNLQTFDDSIDKLKATLNGTKNALAAVFAPSLTEGANALTEVIAQNQAALEQFAASLVANVVPIVQDFVNAFAGNDEAVQNSWVLQIRDQLFEFATAAEQAFNEIIIPAMNAIIGLADGVAAAINSIFGTDLSGKALLIAAAVFSVIGVFGALASIIGVVVSAISLLGSTFGAAAIAVIAIGTAIVAAAFALANTDWGGIAQGIVSAIVGAFRAIGGAIKGAISTAIGVVRGLFEDFASYIAGTWVGKIIAAIGKIINKLRGAKAAAEREAGSSSSSSSSSSAGGRARGVAAGSIPAGMQATVGSETVFGPALVAATTMESLASMMAPASASSVAGEPRQAGGAGGPRSVVNLSIGGEGFSLEGDDDTVARLGRHVARMNTRSLGRRPSSMG